VSEYPIPFSGEMIRAILDGRKTQTRRVITRIHGCSEWLLTDNRIVDTQEMLSQPTVNLEYILSHCPYGLPGDRLWVRESWRIEKRGDLYLLDYRADPGCPTMRIGHSELAARYVTDNRKYRPSIFMPRWASRITLEIESVRVERVQDIDETDVCAEGAPFHCLEIHEWDFAALWDSINAKRGYGWDTNPWVWVVAFSRVEQ